MIGVLRVKIKAKPFQAPDKKILDTDMIWNELIIRN